MFNITGRLAKRYNPMNKTYLYLILFVCMGGPLIGCIIFKIFPIGSIGPIVPISGIFNAFFIPYLIYKCFYLFFKKHEIEFVLIIISIPTGIFLAVIEMNILIGLSSAFGIMDYQLM